VRYYFDTEFIEYPCTIDLISIGIVAEDGREFYAEASDFDESKAVEWVRENVISKLWHRQEDKKEFNAWTRDGGIGGLMKKHEIGSAIRRFILPDEKPEFWAYYADYDWVVFCWLQGTMINLPKGWPMYCRDLKQEADRFGVKFPQQTEGHHNALADAKWNREMFNWLSCINPTKFEL